MQKRVFNKAQKLLRESCARKFLSARSPSARIRKGKMKIWITNWQPNYRAHDLFFRKSKGFPIPDACQQWPSKSLSLGSSFQASHRLCSPSRSVKRFVAFARFGSPIPTKYNVPEASWRKIRKIDFFTESKIVFGFYSIIGAQKMCFCYAYVSKCPPKVIASRWKE